MFQKIFCIKHSMYTVPREEGSALGLNSYGAQTICKISQNIRTLLDQGERVVFINSPELYLRQSTQLLKASFYEREQKEVQTYEHPNYWQSLSKPGKDQPMLDFIIEKSRQENASVVILLTNRPGIVDLAMFLQKRNKNFYHNFWFLSEESKADGSIHLIDLTTNPVCLTDIMQVKCPKRTKQVLV